MGTSRPLNLTWLYVQNGGNLFEDTRQVQKLITTLRVNVTFILFFNSFTLWNFKGSQQCCPDLSV